MKKLPIITATAFYFILAFFPFFSFAQNYDLLAPLPGLETFSSDSNIIEKYFSNIYQLGISLIIVLAVVMLVFGGIQYMMTDSITKKGEARDTIVAAVVGLILAVGSYAILTFIIGDRATSFDFITELEPIKMGDVVEIPPEECVIPPNQNAESLCTNNASDLVISEVVGDENCGGVRPAGAICCRVSAMGDTSSDWVRPISRGECTYEELENSRTISTKSPQTDCYSEIVRQIPREDQSVICEEKGINAYSYITEEDFINRANDSNSSCFGVDTDGVASKFVADCESIYGGTIYQNSDSSTITSVPPNAMYCGSNSNIGVINPSYSCENNLRDTSINVSPPFISLQNARCINGDYGSRDPNYANHRGIDFLAEGGIPVSPVMPGKVVYVGKVGAGGNQIRIEHTLPEGRKIYTEYLHLQEGSMGVSVGDVVNPGDTIGRSDNSGTDTTGYHLHIQFLNSPNKTDHFDPAELFGGDIQAMARGLTYNLGFCYN